MKKKTTDLELMMLYLHSKQALEWSNFILDSNNIIFEFKFRVKDVRNSAKLMVDYCEKVMNNEDSETAAEISDSLYRMAQLPHEKIDELSKIMNEYLDKNL